MMENEQSGALAFSEVWGAIRSILQREAADETAVVTQLSTRAERMEFSWLIGCAIKILQFGYLPFAD
ncbi:hypothetical protein ACVXHM_33565 [Pseudomonas aeruginosa]|uniref:hypothetical protein n=1 Tax=Pseudomonadaceae TaxID=135621 RepID=UPI00146D00E7|nr:MULTISPECIES: hypothetical protein [Pseudomonas]WAG78949.1 hypothetical protein LMK08_27035 [Pseudomonas furukawaii]